jgi:hypothetical protein
LIEISADPLSPGPGGSATLTITVSGTRGGDKYGVPGVTVQLAFAQAPAADAQLDPTSVTTDQTGTATTRLTLSKKAGRHLITASGGGLQSSLTLDTLAPPARDPTRARHVEIDPLAPPAQPRDMTLFFYAAAVVLIVGFGAHYARRPARPAARPSRLPVIAVGSTRELLAVIGRPGVAPSHAPPQKRDAPEKVAPEKVAPEKVAREKVAPEKARSPAKKPARASPAPRAPLSERADALADAISTMRARASKRRR